MRVTYDKEADAVYIYIKYPIRKLLGVEVLDASKILNKKFIREAKRID